MSNQASEIEDLDLGSLVAGIAQDSGRLLEQQIGLLRDEIKQEAARIGEGAVQVAAGGGLLAAGGLLTGMMLAHIVQRATRLPLWMCYGIVGGGMTATGIAQFIAGREKLSSVQMTPPPETATAFKENVEWLKNQLGSMRDTTPS